MEAPKGPNDISVKIKLKFSNSRDHLARYLDEGIRYLHNDVGNRCLFNASKMSLPVLKLEYSNCARYMKPLTLKLSSYRMRWDMGKGEVSNLKTGTATIREEDTQALVGIQSSSPRVPLQIVPNPREDLVHVRLGKSVQLQVVR